MNSAIDAYCPEWCTAYHSPQNFVESDLVVHWKSFGNSNDGGGSLVQAWVINCGKLVETSGVTVHGSDLQSSEELTQLASICLEASEWMKENFGHQIVSELDSTQRIDHFAI